MKDKSRLENPLAEMLIVSQKNLEKIYHARIHKRHCSIREVEDKIFAGHSASPACYFVERYYEKVSVAELVSLAAHTILSASPLNPTGIRGLEIIKCTQEGMFAVPDSAIKSLEKREETTSQELKRLLFAPV